MADTTVLTAKSAHPRIAWCFEALKVGESLELHIFKRKHDGDIVLYSPSGARSETKVPFGRIVKCTFVTGINSKTKLATESFEITNEDNRKGVFDIEILNMFLKEQNPFTAKCGQLLVDKKYQLLAKYFSLLVHSRQFSQHNQDVHTAEGFLKDGNGNQAADLIQLRGSVQEYGEILSLAEQYAGLSEKPSKPRKRKITEFFGPENLPVKKLTKSAAIEKTFEEELNNDLGVEKLHSLAFLGRADIPIKNLSVSPLLGIPIDQTRVSSIQKSMKEIFNPAKATLTVSPVDGSNVDLKNIHEQKFHVVHGVHSFLAMQNLHAKGLYSKLLGVKNDCVLSFVVNLPSQAAGHNYANVRNNQIDSKHPGKPGIHTLVYIYKKLKQEYHDANQATEAIESIARLMRAPAEDLSAIRKICFWSDEALKILVEVLTRYEKYATLDAFEQNSSGSMKSGKPLKLNKEVFRKIAKCDVKFFVQNAKSILDKEASLITVIEESEKAFDKEKAKSSLLQLSQYKDIATVSVRYPDKFTPEIMKKYAGAEVMGKNRNNAGDRLESYYKSVVNDKEENVKGAVDVEEYKDIRDVTSNLLESYDIVVLNFKKLYEDYVQYVIDAAATTLRDTFAVLILTASGADQKKVLSMTKVWEEKEGFSVTQVFFQKDTPSEGNFEFIENVDHSVLLGKVKNHGENIPVLLDNLEDSLTDLLSKLCPRIAKLAVILGPKSSILPIDHFSGQGWDRVKYYVDNALVKKVNRRFLTQKRRFSVQGALEEEATEDEESVNLLVVSEKINDAETICEEEEDEDMPKVDSLDVENTNTADDSNSSVYEFEKESDVKSLTRNSSTSKY